MECIQESEKQGETGIYVRKPASHKYHENIKTLYHNFNQGLSVSPNNPFLGSRTKADSVYNWITYAEVDVLRRRLGSFLHDKFNSFASTLNCVGIYSKNRPEWIIAEQACNAYSLITVPLCKQ